VKNIFGLSKKFLVLFLSLMIIMSRFVLSEVTPIKAHVENAQSLLEDIDEVKIFASQNMENKSGVLDFQPKTIPEYSQTLNDIGGEINGISYFNSKFEGNSVISITLNGKIGDENGIYYLELPAIGILKGDLIAYKINGVIYTGKFLVLDSNENIHIETMDGVLSKITQKELLGKVFYIEEKNEESIEN